MQPPFEPDTSSTKGRTDVRRLDEPRTPGPRTATEIHPRAEKGFARPRSGAWRLHLGDCPHLWRRAQSFVPMEAGHGNATNKGLKANEEVVAKSELKKAEARIRELERALGRKTMENEFLQEAVKIAREKKWLSGGNSDSESDGK